ncbi:DUF2487 family protein [Staphylospora marina]|uniref:DUF2487 family protein n=1 Tax=Staphylospora marina TaxID=2490858 RepID=UPI0013DDE18B|nr:DUF2487 family protein [Staphylospora marina]
MRLWTIDHAEWQKAALFVDTLLLPVCPFELREKRLFLDAGKRMERLAAAVEAKLAGRVLLLPPLHYVPRDGDVWNSVFQGILEDIRSAGFDFLVIVGHGLPDPDFAEKPEPVRVLVHRPEEDASVEEASERLYGKILDLWQRYG